MQAVAWCLGGQENRPDRQRSPGKGWNTTAKRVAAPNSVRAVWSQCGSDHMVPMSAEPE